MHPNAGVSRSPWFNAALDSTVPPTRARKTDAGPATVRYEVKLATAAVISSWKWVSAQPAGSAIALHSQGPIVFFQPKLHIGNIRLTRLIHHLSAGADSQMAPLPLHGAERPLDGAIRHTWLRKRPKIRAFAPHLPRRQFKRPCGGALDGIQRAAHCIRVKHSLRVSRSSFVLPKCGNMGCSRTSSTTSRSERWPTHYLCATCWRLWRGDHT